MRRSGNAFPTRSPWRFGCVCRITAGWPYALHAPEVECIGKGKARTSYEFGCKVSVATPTTRPKGGQFVLHAKALHGNPFDGHTLAPVIAGLEALTGIETRRIHVDKGYRGHNHAQKF